MKYKPCPFCGNTSEEEFALIKEKQALCATYQIVCSCGARGMDADTKEEAVEKWNTRPGEKEMLDTLIMLKTSCDKDWPSAFRNITSDIIKKATGEAWDG